MTKEDKPTKTKSSELSTEDLDQVVGGTGSPGGQNDGYTATDDLFQVSGFDGGPPPGADPIGPEKPEAVEKPVSEKADALEKPTEANKLTPDAEKPGSEKAWSVPGGVYEVD